MQIPNVQVLSKLAGPPQNPFAPCSASALWLQKSVLRLCHVSIGVATGTFEKYKSSRKCRSS